MFGSIDQAPSETEAGKRMDIRSFIFPGNPHMDIRSFIFPGNPHMDERKAFGARLLTELPHDQATYATFLGHGPKMFLLCFDDSSMRFATRGKDEIQVGSSR